MPTDIEKVRMEVADTDPTLPILSDDVYEYFLEKNHNSIAKASMDAARSILLHLAQRGDETVDILSIKGRGAAEQYRFALELFLKDPNLNPVLQNARGYFGGVSKSDMEQNNANSDNNTVKFPSSASYGNSDPFLI